MPPFLIDAAKMLQNNYIQKNIGVWLTQRRTPKVFLLGNLWFPFSEHRFPIFKSTTFSTFLRRGSSSTVKASDPKAAFSSVFRVLGVLKSGLKPKKQLQQRCEIQYGITWYDGKNVVHHGRREKGEIIEILVYCGISWYICPSFCHKLFAIARPCLEGGSRPNQTYNEHF